MSLPSTPSLAGVLADVARGLETTTRALVAQDSKVDSLEAALALAHQNFIQLEGRYKDRGVRLREVVATLQSEKQARHVAEDALKGVREALRGERQKSANLETLLFAREEKLRMEREVIVRLHQTIRDTSAPRPRSIQDESAIPPPLKRMRINEDGGHRYTTQNESTPTPTGSSARSSRIIRSHWPAVSSPESTASRVTVTYGKRGLNAETPATANPQTALTSVLFGGRTEVSPLPEGPQSPLFTEVASNYGDGSQPDELDTFRLDDSQDDEMRPNEDSSPSHPQTPSDLAEDSVNTRLPSSTSFR
ncbi:hypothetical protein C8R44DRAFT_356176 [Mycena epipterygia]|nr:hypothetical protein C8R44DRAFT_356176 [Mycena epipterygia]